MRCMKSLMQKMWSAQEMCTGKFVIVKILFLWLVKLMYCIKFMIRLKNVADSSNRLCCFQCMLLHNVVHTSLVFVAVCGQNKFKVVI